MCNHRKRVKTSDSLKAITKHDNMTRAVCLKNQRNYVSSNLSSGAARPATGIHYP